MLPLPSLGVWEVSAGGRCGRQEWEFLHWLGGSPHKEEGGKTTARSPGSGRRTGTQSRTPDRRAPSTPRRPWGSVLLQQIDTPRRRIAPVDVDTPLVFWDARSSHQSMAGELMKVFTTCNALWQSWNAGEFHDTKDERGISRRNNLHKPSLSVL